MLSLIINSLNSLVRSIAAFIAFVIAFFPDSPFSEPSRPPDSINLSWLTWLLDFPTWILHFSFVLTAIGIYYFYRVAARWIKVVRD